MNIATRNVEGSKIIEPLKPGIYLGLSDTAYHADAALGSSGIRALRRGAKITIASPATVMGSAIHKHLLEGRETFERIYMRRPDDPEGASSSEKGAVTKAANLKAAAALKILLHGDDYDFIQNIARLISAHPDLAGALTNFLPEVSIFWERDGVRMKCRIDALKPRGLGDIKSIANEKKDRLSTACKWNIKRHRYDIQAEHYMEGRRMLPALFKAGHVFFADAIPPADRARQTEMLERIASAKEFAFQFIFVPKDGTPTVWSCIWSPGNPMLQFARGHIEEALDIYRNNREQFDAEPNWAVVEPVEELMIEDMPGGEFGWD